MMMALILVENMGAGLDGDALVAELEISWSWLMRIVTGEGREGFNYV